MIRELLRPLLRWLFWNRHRPVLVLAALLIAVAVLGRLSGCGAGSPGNASVPASPPAVTASTSIAVAGAAPSAAHGAQPAAFPARPPATPAGTGLVPAEALDAARAFLRAWVSHAGDRAARIRATATPQLAAQVTGPAASLAPATALTGPVTVTGQAAGTVNVSVPTNAGPALLTVRITGGRWLAAQVMLARTGN